jgi:hypothetical protein
MKLFRNEKELFSGRRNTIIRLFTFVLAGTVMGYLFFYFIGCRTGSCLITSNPFYSTLYGSLIGLFWGFSNKSKKDNGYYTRQ